jgi:hypothetical protein
MAASSSALGGRSANHIVLLSRATLERPYVLAELVYAYKQKKKILCVRANWPGDEHAAESKSFAYPETLNEAISDWEDVAYFQRSRTLETDQPLERIAFVRKVSAKLRAWPGALVGCLRG